MRRTKPRLTVAERRQEAEFHQASEDKLCGACVWNWAVASHHVVYAQHLPREHRWRLENVMPICQGCHAAHHNASRRIRADRLTEVHLQFANDVLGAGAGDYLRRRYG